MWSSKLKKVRYQIIFLISLCDMFAAIGTVFGFTTTGTPECWVQSMFTQIFPLASAFWTLLIGVHVIFIIRSIPIHAETFVGWKMFFLCFGIPVVVTLLPFSTSTYGCVDDEPCWCFVKDTKDSPDWAMTVWYVVSFYMWIWACLLLNVGLLVYSMISMRNFSRDEYRGKVLQLLFKLLGYPVVIIVCWTCTTMYDLILVVDYDHYTATDEVYLNLSVILPCFQGLLATIVFVMTHINFRNDISKEVHPSSVSGKPVDVNSSSVLPVEQFGNTFSVDVPKKVAPEGDEVFTLDSNATMSNASTKIYLDSRFPSKTDDSMIV